MTLGILLSLILLWELPSLGNKAPIIITSDLVRLEHCDLLALTEHVIGAFYVRDIRQPSEVLYKGQVLLQTKLPQIYYLIQGTFHQLKNHYICTCIHLIKQTTGLHTFLRPLSSTSYYVD